MLLQDVFLENAKADLFDLVVRHKPKPVDSNFPWDSYIAMSLMQKAIRRGDENNALSAGMFLLNTNERSFWKRLCICALEDVGIANLKLVAQVLIVDKGKRLREGVGDSDRIAQALLCALCKSPKDRCSDDLIDAIKCGSGYSEYIADVAELPIAHLKAVIASKAEPIQHRAIAAVQLATGWDAFPSGLRKGHSWFKVLHDISEDVASPCVLAVSLLGIQRTGALMAPLLTLLYAHKPLASKYVDDDLLNTVDINGLPSWVLDGHVRSGLHSFRIYIHRSCRMKRFLARFATREVSPSKTVAGLVFRIESGQLANRLDWAEGRQLKLQACANRPGLPADAAPEAMSILRSEFDLLNECRITAMRDYIR